MCRSRWSPPLLTGTVQYSAVGLGYLPLCTALHEYVSGSSLQPSSHEASRGFERAGWMDGVTGVISITEDSSCFYRMAADRWMHMFLPGRFAVCVPGFRSQGYPQLEPSVQFLEEYLPGEEEKDQPLLRESSVLCLHLIFGGEENQPNREPAVLYHWCLHIRFGKENNNCIVNWPRSYVSCEYTIR